MTETTTDTLRFGSAILAILGAIAIFTGRTFTAAFLYALAYLCLSFSVWGRSDD